jgi:4-hydroxy-tetrahydrodipicolinate synthase
MAQPDVGGLLAAVPTPVRTDGGVDLEMLDRVIEFVVGCGVDGICVGGATGEYPHFEMADRIAVIRRASNRLPRGRTLMAGIGAAALSRTIELGRAAFEAGCAAVLLPMPFFFRYQQHDLQAYCAHVNRALAAPCLLYDLPSFTTPLQPETAIALMRDEEYISGIKDSSGCADNLTRFAAARADRDWTLLVGDDRLLSAGLGAGWDGGISGLAAFCPELMSTLCRAFADERHDEVARLQNLVDQLITQAAALPTPWAVRVGLRTRGYDTGALPLPLSAERQRTIRSFDEWFGKWLHHIAVPGLNRRPGDQERS